MKRSLRVLGSAIAFSLALLHPTAVSAFQADHQRDVVYGYKDGMALVMDVFTPEVGQNAGGIILVVAGGMRSSPMASHRAGDGPDVQNLLNGGPEPCASFGITPTASAWTRSVLGSWATRLVGT